MRTKKILIAVLSLIGIGVAVLVFQWWPSPDGFERIQTQLPPETVDILVNAEQFVLLSLDPLRPALRPESDPPPEETFHEYEVLGKGEIRSDKERVTLLNALFNGIADSDGSVASCFNPRHGISATHNGQTVDLVICFECLSMRIYSKKDAGVLTTRSPASVFNRAVARAGLPKPTR